VTIDTQKHDARMSLIRDARRFPWMRERIVRWYTT